MLNIKNPWEFIKQQKEKAILIASIISLCTGVINSLLDKANPPIISLSVFSILLIGIFVWMIFIRTEIEITDSREQPILKRKYSFSQILWAWVAGFLILLLAWSFIYREHLIYSKMVDKIIDSKRIAVSDNLAWEILTYDTKQGKKKSNTFVGELSSILKDTPYRPVVFNKKDFDSRKILERDGFSFDCSTEKAGITLKSITTFNGPRMKRFAQILFKEGLKEFEEKIKKKQTSLLILPIKHFFRNPYSLQFLQIELPLSSELSSKQRATLARLFVRYAVALMLFYDDDPHAYKLFHEIVEISQLLPSMQSKPLSTIYKSTGYYLAAFAHGPFTSIKESGMIYSYDPPDAFKALDIARSFDPEDPEIYFMQIYLLMSYGAFERAAKLLTDLKNINNDMARFYALQGLYNMCCDQYEDAIESFKSALPKEKDEGILSYLNFAIAMAYGMSKNITDSERSIYMIGYLEDAILAQANLRENLLRPNLSLLYIMQGYAWALQGNVSKFHSTFNKVSSLSDTLENDNIFKYWFNKSLLILKQQPQVIENLLKLMNEPVKDDNLNSFIILAESLLNPPNMRLDDAEELIDRVLQNDSDHPKANRLKGIALSLRLVNTPQSKIKERRKLNELSRSYLIKSIELGDEKAKAHDIIAILYEKSGDAVNALKHLNRACNLSVTIERLHEKARILIELNDNSTAHEVFTRARQLKPNDDTVLLSEGIIWQNAGMNTMKKELYDKAIDVFSETIELNPECNEAYFNRGIVYYNMDLDDKAIGDFCKAIEIEPKYAAAYNSRGFIYSEKGLYDKAIADYNIAIEINPKNEEVYNNRGIAYYNMDLDDKAVADYNKAIEINPNLPDAYNNRGIIYSEKGLYDEAIADYNMAIEINPKYAVAYRNRGNVYSSKGQLDSAIYDYNKAIDLDPKDENAYFNCGSLYYSKGLYDKAIAYLDSVVQINSQNFKAYVNRGFAYANKGLYDNAIDDYNKAIEINPNCIEAYNYRGIAYYNKSLYGKAIADFNKVVETNPEDGMVYFNLGLCQLNTNKYNSAIISFQQAMKIGLGHNQSYAALLLADLLKVQRREKEIEKQLMEALETIGERVWPADLLKLYLEIETPENVLKIANEAKENGNLGKSCEASLYVGLWYLRRGNVEKAKSLFKRCIVDKVEGYIEPHIAENILENL